MGLLDLFVRRDTTNKEEDSTTAESIMRRAKALPESELAVWIDNAAVSCGRNMSHALRSDREEESQALMAEAEIDATALRLMIQEVQSRKGFK